MTNLTVVRVPSTPAKRKAPDYLDFEKLQEQADMCIKPYQQIGNELWRAKPSEREDGGAFIYQRRASDRLDDLEGNLRYWEATGFLHFMATEHSGLLERLGQFDHAKHYDENGRLTRKAVAERLAWLVDSFPVCNVPNVEVYTTMLVDEVRVANVTLPALEAACREIRRTMKFLPSVAEVLPILKKHEKLWDTRTAAIHYLPRMLKGAEELCQQLRNEIAEEKAEQEYRKQVLLATSPDEIPF
jgi:hypothetical protein